MTDKVRVRFAPSPTGLLHIGGARTAIYNWAFARKHKGTFILRIDDTDPERSTEENTQAILDSLTWLGIDWDEGPLVGGDYGPYFQTQRFDTYEEALEQLKAKGEVYPCFCTAEELAKAREDAAQRSDSFQGYPGTCRHIPKEEAEARIAAGEPHTWRIRVPEKETVTFEDVVRGPQVFQTKDLDDFVLMRSDGTPTYNYATVVDDALMEITHIIRGDDHISNTPRQVMVYEALGYEVPKFAHLSMILGSDGKRLSKRHGATGVKEYKDRGFLPETMINYLTLLGWSLDGETTIFSVDTLKENFDLQRISKNPAVFDDEKLQWMNGEYLKALSDEAFTEQATVPALLEAGLIQEGDYEARKDWFIKTAELAKPRIRLIPEIAPLLQYLFDDTMDFDQKSVEKNVAKEGIGEVLDKIIEALEGIDENEWDVAHIDEVLQPMPEVLEISKKKFFQAIRVGITFSQVSPQLSESMELLGKERSLARLRKVRALAL
ncbi:MAG: glutamate--tRNA ligase [Coriobacteriia bacterium]|nr:glutamate--tRNA ligase [Coriobacteriia bacterium]